MSPSGKAEPLLLVILGPTGSGKSALAITLAQRFSGEIVSCDSVAVYRDFDIGTAKPTREQRALVPHHLLDIAAPYEPFTAGDYSRVARAAIADISGRSKLPVVVGGTGLYLRALLEGLFPGPRRSEELRERLRVRAAERGSQYLHNILIRLDPSAAAKIHANDTAKLIRAIEVCLTTSTIPSPAVDGGPVPAARARMSDLWRQRGRDPLYGFRVLRIGLNPPREKLYERINSRAQAMFANGLVAETKSLVEEFGGNEARITALDSLGYRQAREYLKDELSLERAILAAQQGHRNYAKRQMTWFRREPEVSWLEGFGDDPEIARRAAELIEREPRPSQ